MEVSNTVNIKLWFSIVLEGLFRNGIGFPVVEVFAMSLEFKKEGFFSGVGEVSVTDISNLQELQDPILAPQPSSLMDVRWSTSNH